MTRNQIILLASILFLSACGRKAFERKIEGDLSFKSTGAPVVNAKITFLETNNGNSGTQLGQTTTDSEGHFEILYEHQGGDLWTIFVNADSLSTKQNVSRNQKKVSISL